MTDFRALCAELEHAAQELEIAENALLCSSFHNSAIRAKAAAHRARAALAQAEPEGPTDEKLLGVAARMTDRSPHHATAGAGAPLVAVPRRHEP